MVPGLVVEAGASWGPGSSGIPSGPGALAAAELVLVVDEEERRADADGLDELGAVALAELALAALEEVDELLPQPATASAAALISAAIQIRGLTGAER